MINENRINMVSERGGKISSGYAGHKCFAIWKINPTTADPASHSHHPETCFGHGHQRRLNLVSGKNSLGSGSYWTGRDCSRDAKGAVKGMPGWHSWRPASPPRSSIAFSRAYQGGRNRLHHKIKAIRTRLQICWSTPEGVFQGRKIVFHE